MKAWLEMKTLEKTLELDLIIFTSFTININIQGRVIFNTELSQTLQETATKLLSKVMPSKAWLVTKISVKQLESVLIPFTTEEPDIESSPDCL